MNHVLSLISLFLTYPFKIHTTCCNKNTSPAPMSSLILQSDTHYHFPPVASQPPFTFPSWTVFRSSSSRRPSNSSTRVYQRFNRGNKISLLPIKSLHVVSSRFGGVSLSLACSPPFSALVAAANVDDQTLPLNKACLSPHSLPYLKILYSYVSIAGVAGFSLLQPSFLRPYVLYYYYSTLRFLCLTSANWIMPEFYGQSMTRRTHKATCVGGLLVVRICRPLNRGAQLPPVRLFRMKSFAPLSSSEDFCARARQWLTHKKFC